ncbi:MAG: T9SS type A sorting domain-containing protein [Bacteroidales bacterium]|jgi:hypothetical protein|nr:T9SS type A sorting domain-containing protein [Bacteroidales bacterium]
MKKYLLLLVCCIFLASTGFSQVLYELTIKQGENFPSCVFNTDNDETIVGLFEHYEFCKLIKINKDGFIVDSLVFDMEDYIVIDVVNIIKAEQPHHYLALMIKNEGTLYNPKYHIVVFEFDDNFNILWEKTIDVIEGPVYAVGGEFWDGYYYIFMGQSPLENEAHFYKLNTEGEVVHSAIHQDHYLTRFMTHIPNTNSFIFNKGEDDLNLDIINTDLEIEINFRYATGYVIFPNLEFINDSIFITSGMGATGYWGGHWEDYSERIVIRATNLNEILENMYAPFQTTVFGEEGVGGYPWYPGCRMAERQSLAMHDDYFFFAGTGLFNNSAGPPYDKTDNFIMIYVFDHNLDSLWAMHLGYDAYYHTWSVAPTIDGGCVVVARRYDWHDSENIETYIVRIAKPDFPQPCNPVTEVSATIESDCKSATVTWTTVDNAKEYKIFRDDIELGVITASPYIDEFDFEDETTYTWGIVAICESGESEEVFVLATADCGQGIQELSNSIAVYPNPGNDMLTIDIAFNDFAFRMYDITGKLISERKNQKNISTQHLPPGIYLYRIFSDNQTMTSGKWVKK